MAHPSNFTSMYLIEPTPPHENYVTLTYFLRNIRHMQSAVQIPFGHYFAWQVDQTSPAGTSYRPHTTPFKLSHCDLLSPKYTSHAVCATNPVLPLPWMAGVSKLTTCWACPQRPRFTLDGPCDITCYHVNLYEN
jgi:hypothetical protein